MKKITAIFLLLCLLVTVVPVGVLATETTEATEAVEEFEVMAPNQCGPDLTWEFNGGTLTISGSGDMDHYPDGDAPWLPHKDSIEKLVFTGSVTSVGECAFMDYDSLKEVDFGSAMHTIGRRAFKSCDGLTTFTLPATFRQFGEECFMGCTWLREIRCLGGMPSFRSSCLWDCPVSVFYPTTNPWPAEYVTPLYQSYQGKLQIFMGDGIEEAGAQTADTQPQETVPETTEAVTEPATEPVTEPVTEPTTQPTTAPTEAPTEEVPTEQTQAPTVPTEPEWLRETQPEEKAVKDAGMNGLLIGMILITGTLSLVLIGALIFRRRRY